ncbi:ATP synthase I chain [Desulfonauticus submarinus]|uniref:ATP synthase I chain n=1 Tax=Desulfonauticus submarinus TaxID=206665 RepID=A0A1H0BC36_9BACT|nr:ATP synthase subunit I [Desulfonauticus submarinus]SDN43161.1 ATP synthase I chain [Desulfonauticus submarinus]
MKTIHKKIEKFLYSRGFQIEGTRILMRNQIYFSILGCFIAIILGYSTWALDFIIGVLLGSFNFYFLAKFVQEIIHIKKGALAALLFHFYLRLAVTGLILFYVIVYFKVNIVALLGGLSIVIVNVLFYGLNLVGEKFKEA